MKSISILCLILFYSFVAHSQLTFFKAILQGSQEVPPNASPGSGVAIVRYNTTTKILELVGNYQNLLTAAVNAHIHSPAPVGVNASVLIPLAHTGGTTGALSGMDTLTAAQEADLLDTLMYVNVHTTGIPAGELRGQLIPTGPDTYYLTGQLSGAQEVPANGSTGTGTVAVLLDNTTNEVFLASSFEGLSANASAAHIHRGPVGVNGPVIVTLSHTAATSGAVAGSAVVSNTFADSMIAGNTYVNIHNANFPGGEIRAQLGNVVLPVTLKYFNAYKQNNKIALVWESEEEQDLKQYEIEQQGQQPGNWINKAVVSVKGGNTPSKYSFLDDPIVNSTGYVIYRLKMTDIDGTFSYSPVIRLNFFASKAELSIAANPVVNGRLKYTVTGLPNNKKAEIYIVDYSGKVVAKTTASSLVNNSMNIANLTAGTYRLIVRIDENIFQKTFVK